METVNPGRSWASDRDWEQHKDIIERLYNRDRKPLREVAAVLSKEHGFHATAKMYKTRFKKWGFRKNLSTAESLHIQRQIYTGVASLPVAHGRSLGSKRLKALVWSGQRTLEMRDASITQTVPRCIRTPDVIRLTESALYEVSTYSKTNLEARRWDFSTDNNLTSETATWGIQLVQTAMHIRERNHNLGFRLLNECCAQFRSILHKQQSILVWAILVVVIKLDAANEKVALAFIRFVAEMCSIEIGSLHPLAKLCHDMLSIIKLLGLSQAKLSARLILISQLEVFRGKPGQDNFFVDFTNAVMVQWLNDCGMVSDEPSPAASETVIHRTQETVSDPEVYYRQVQIGLLLAGRLTWKKNHYKAVVVLRLIDEANRMSDLIVYDQSKVLTNHMRAKACVGERLAISVTNKLRKRPVANIRYLPGYVVFRWLGHADTPFKALDEIE